MILLIIFVKRITNSVNYESKNYYSHIVHQKIHVFRESFNTFPVHSNSLSKTTSLTHKDLNWSVLWFKTKSLEENILEEFMKINAILQVIWCKYSLDFLSLSICYFLDFLCFKIWVRQSLCSWLITLCNFRPW